MENIKELRNELIEMLELHKKEQLKTSDLKERTNTLGKVISSVKTEMDYNKMMGYQRKIDFLEFN